MRPLSHDPATNPSLSPTSVDRRSQPAIREPGLSITSGRVRRDSYHRAKLELDDLLVDLAAKNQERLPSEEELSELLQVSRATVRSALLSLQKEGKVQRVHGRGTFINRHASEIQANISQDRPFATLLEELGHTVAVHNIDVRIAPLEAGLVEPLALRKPEDACLIERIFTASGKPAVFSVDTIPVSYLLEVTGNLDGHESVFEFVRRNTGRQVRYSVADIIPVVATQETASNLQVAVGAPLILLQHVHIDQQDRPIAYTRAYINDGLLRFSVVRTYTDS